MENSIIFFDIDGTLIDEDKNVPRTTKEAIFQLKERGHEVAIATGRAPYMYEDLRKELDIHTYVSFNGQLVVVKDEVIYTNPLNKEALHLLTCMAKKHNHPIIYMDEYEMKANVLQHDFITESLNSLKLPVQASLDPNYYKGRDIFQSMLFIEEQEELLYEQTFKDFKFVRWHPLSVDIDPAGGSKAKGIEIVLRHLGYSMDQVYAFGDGLNDIEMLSFTPNSVAMGNAEPLTKKAAKYITKSVNEDGILHGIKMVGLL
ncbi:Cof-type HAD-IIB family hydrolase [Neobacillus sp. FSL H8-0543]|uniref:Cof-type HAD-IIB family hydrolase n=1 Tax=Neobacillus sp. FSL H8-0543 TaxID=2954672 RepID=UPI003158E85E